MEIKKTWFEKLDALEKDACEPLGNAPAASVYSAIRANKAALNGKKFRLGQSNISGKTVVCRVK
jgi:hypothetical protein